MNIGLVYCHYPEDMFEEGGSPPEGFEEWKTSEFCTHDYCIEAASYLRQWRAERPYRESVALARAEIDSDETGEDLTPDEMHRIQMELK